MNIKINWFFIGSIGLNVFLAICLFHGCGPIQPCPEGVIVKTRIDTVYPKNPVGDVTIKVPVPQRIIHLSKGAARPPLVCQPEGPLEPGPSGIFSYSPLAGVAVPAGSGGQFDPCDDIVTYSDTTFKKNEYRAIIYDSIQHNKVLIRHITFYNLMPQIIKEVEISRPIDEKVRCYIGAFGGFSTAYTTGTKSWSIGPSLLLTAPQGVAFSYGFDAHNNGHLINLFYKIKLKK